MRRQDWILLVESENRAANDLRALILQLGYQVLVCGECSKASWYLKNQKFVCVVVDHQVIGANGWAVISAIKKNSSHINNKTPFILVSEAFEHDFVARIADHIDGALLKPIDESQFVNKVKSAVQSQRTKL